MANLRYDLAPGGPVGRWGPYLGVGLGAADLTTDEDAPFGISAGSQWAPAYQVLAGAGYGLSPRLRLFGELRWFGVMSAEWDDDWFTFDASEGTVDLLLGLRFVRSDG